MKIRYLVALSLTLAPLLISCGQKQDPDPTSGAVRFDPPKFLEEAVKMTVTDPSTGYDTIEMTESGLYVIRMSEQVLTGTYSTDKSGSLTTYLCDGFGKVEVNEVVTRADLPTQIVITREGRDPVTVEVTAVANTPAEESSLAKLCRTWIPEKTIISASGGDIPASLGVAHAEKGCDLPGIQNYLKNNGLTIDYDLTGYTVTDLSFTANGTIIVRFSGAEDFEGAFRLNQGDTFSYTFNGTEVGNPLFNGQANGSVLFEQENNRKYCELTLNAQINAEKNYSGKLVLLLTEKK